MKKLSGWGRKCKYCWREATFRLKRFDKIFYVCIDHEVNIALMTKSEASK